MFINLSATLALYVIFKLVRGESSKEHHQDVSTPSNLKSNLEYIPTPDTWEMNPKLNSMWAYQPSSHQSEKGQNNEFQKSFLKGPFPLTRLAKPLTLGFDPYFNKGHFEPFERRQRPVTLVAFRRNGLLPRRSVKVDENNEPVVAEMQSPFNEVSNFWQNDPAFVNE